MAGMFSSLSEMNVGSESFDYKCPTIVVSKVIVYVIDNSPL